VPIATQKVVLVTGKGSLKPILHDRNMEYKVEELDIKVVRTPLHYEPLSDILSQLPEAIQAIISKVE